MKNSYQEMDDEQSWRNFESNANRGIPEMNLNKFKKGVNRREFLMALGIFGLSGKILSDVLINEHKKHLISKIYNELPSQIYLAEHKAEVKTGGETKEKIQKGYGIIINKHYITPAHICDFSAVDVMTPFGRMTVNQDVLSQEAYLGKNKLEQKVIDTKRDVAVFKLPENMKGYIDFQAEPSTKINLGDEVYLIGNPKLSGVNIRKANISDLNGYIIPNNTIQVEEYFGVDQRLIAGDSGTPVVSKDFKLLGLSEINFYGLGYVKKIGEFLKHIK